MPEETVPAPEPGKINVPILDLPSREDRRAIVKTGRDTKGNEVHPDTKKHLRAATIADLVAFGAEVNKANAALNSVMLENFKAFGTEVDLRFTEVNWNFGSFLNYLGTTGVLPADFLTKYEEFKANAEEEIKKAAAEIEKKQEEAAKSSESLTENKDGNQGQSNI